MANQMATKGREGQSIERQKPSRSQHTASLLREKLHFEMEYRIVDKRGSQKSRMGLRALPHVCFQLLRQGLVRFAVSTAELSAQPKIQTESWFALRYSLRESVVHC